MDKYPCLDNPLSMTTLLLMNKIIAHIVVAALATIALTGCTTVNHNFGSQPADQVWTAMVAVAHSPVYKDWQVSRNDVWVDEDAKRIEIYRRLRRVLSQPASKTRREKREWRFQIMLESTNPPKAVFTSRGLGVPGHAQREGDRYFADVLDLLSGVADEPIEPAANAPDK